MKKIIKLILLGILFNNNSIKTTLETSTNEEAKKITISTPKPKNNISRKEKKKWTMILYMASDNDLYYFALKNINQLRIATDPEITKNANICVQLDPPGPNSKMKRFIVENHKVIELNNPTHSQKINSGDSNSLIDCFSWASRNFPAEHYILVFWNHGTGALTAQSARIINPSDLFVFNPDKNIFELDRTIGYLDYIASQAQTAEEEYRGVCYSDTFKSCLTNKKIEQALSIIKKNYLKGQKIPIVAFDACLMAMHSVAISLKQHTEIMIASQEVELGVGWPYEKIIPAFKKRDLTAEELSRHIVIAYEEKFKNITKDYTHSAINLSNYDQLEQMINDISGLLYECLEQQTANNIKNIIKKCRSKKICTHFDEPSYIDLQHFYKNLISNLKYFQFKNKTKGSHLIQELNKRLKEAISVINKIVIANKTGENLKNAGGISIYFPDYYINKTYVDNPGIVNSKWLPFLSKYLVS